MLNVLCVKTDITLIKQVFNAKHVIGTVINAMIQMIVISVDIYLNQTTVNVLLMFLDIL